MNLLDKIIAQKQREVSPLSRTLKNAKPTKSKRNFKAAITKTGTHPKLIAEIKRASPSRGPIFPNADVLDIAEIYQQCGASAISVLTDTEFFNGSLSDLHTISREVEIPVMRKDFILDPLQILEARCSEADAILIMVSVLKDPKKIKDLIQYAKSMNMDALVETHNAAEIEIACKAGAEIIGVNARNFADLSVDISVFKDLLNLIPNNCVKVAESGLRSIEDVEMVAPYCDAILVGTQFMVTQDEEQIRLQVRKFSGQ